MYVRREEVWRSGPERCGKTLTFIMFSACRISQEKEGTYEVLVRAEGLEARSHDGNYTGKALDNHSSVPLQPSTDRDMNPANPAYIPDEKENSMHARESRAR